MMAQKRIKLVLKDIMDDQIRIIYDDDSRGVIDIAEVGNYYVMPEFLVGLILKQAKMMLGIKT